MMIDLPRDKFEGYFAVTREGVIISQIKSKESGRGNFSQLLKDFMKVYSQIEVPTPSNIMSQILIAKGFKWERKWFGEGFNCFGDILIWRRKNE